MPEDIDSVEATSAAERLAAEIRLRRKAAGLSQPELAAEISYTRQYVSLAERAGKNLPSIELVKAIDAALEAGGSLLKLREAAKAEQRARRAQLGGSPAVSFATEAVRAEMPRLRAALATHDLPDDGPVRPLAVLEKTVSDLVAQRVEARYSQIIGKLPELLSELGRAHLESRGQEREQITQMLAMAYRAADGVAFKFGYSDLSARIIDLMRLTTAESHDRLLAASVSYVRTETFFATGDLDAGGRALAKAIDAMPSSSHAAATATRGSLHMRAAVVAARAGKADEAHDHLDEARTAAADVSEGVYYGTAFGPASVKIHDVAVAVELGDSPTAVQRGRDWRPPRQLPAERQSHYYIDLAGAQLEVGRADDAYASLQLARQIAPQHTREHPRVRLALSALLRSRPTTNADLKDFATWAGAR
ncbi:helix-turn-helix transcriptional regulator [Amycolatopsis sp. NPDC059657]|uniref:helix-turn-helix transcriptional regulator n=1 Tax=Amycolatopsis sp. NPDC059657 TaxID=3346899 RepID=UPI00366ED6AF